MNDAAAGTGGKIIDGKAFAAGLRAPHRRSRSRALQGQARLRAGPGGGAGRRGSGEPGLCPQQGQADRARSAWTPSSTSCRQTTGQAELLALVDAPQRRPGGPRHPGAAAAAQADRSAGGARRHRSGQGRRRLPCRQRRPARDRRPGAGALHAARLPDAAEGPPRRSLGQARRRASAAPTSSASRWRSCCWARTAPSPSPIRAPATCRANAAAPTSWSPPSASAEMVRGDWIKPGATVIDVGINRVDAGDGKTQAGRRRRLCRGRQGRRRHHAGAGRRRPDDHRLPAAEHADRRLPPARHRGAASSCRAVSFRPRTTGSANGLRKGWKPAMNASKLIAHS